MQQNNDSTEENLKIEIENVKKFWCDLLISMLDDFKDNKFKQEKVLESRKWLKIAADVFFSFREDDVNDYYKGVDFIRFAGYVSNFS